MAITISRADVANPTLATFLRAHLDEVMQAAPPESCHALDLAALSAHHLFAATLDGQVVGTVAVVKLSETEAEIKSMRVDPDVRGQGLGVRLTQHALDFARSAGVERVSLETGVDDYFLAAREMYRRVGFRECGPFGDYEDDPNSVYMTLRLDEN